MRLILAPLFTLLSTGLFAQLFAGFGAEYRIPSANRMATSSSPITQIGYQWGDFAAVSQFRVPNKAPDYTVPNWIAGGRLEWLAYDLSLDSLPLPLLNAVQWQVVLSGQWSRLDGHRFRSEHLGLYETDHWTREIYQFQYGRNEFLAGIGIQGRYKSWSALAEVQYGPGARLDTWVYRSHLFQDGNEVIIDNYYFYERYNLARLSITLRKNLTFSSK